MDFFSVFPLRRALTMVGAAWILSSCSSSLPVAPDLGAGAPLGSVVHVASGRELSASKLLAELRDYDVVAVGERHDNGVHHRLQAWIVEGLVAQGRRPAVAFEMFDIGDEAEVALAVTASGGDADAFSELVAWGEGGWPPFELYRPLFEVVLSAGLPVVPANLSRTAAWQAAQLCEGAPVCAGDRLSEAAKEELIDEIVEAHCNAIDRTLAARMAEGQAARDLAMAEAVAGAGAVRGAVLIAGNGHVRRDRGVPLHLAGIAKGSSVASVGLVEGDEAVVVGDARKAPYDYVWITPPLERPDPCEEFAASLSKLAVKD